MRNGSPAHALAVWNRTARPAPVEALASRFAQRDATVAIIGLGHVGLPLALAAAAAGFRTLGIDTDEDKLAALAEGRSPLTHISGQNLRTMTAEGRFRATLPGDREALAAADAIILCVPTPLDPDGDEPDLRHVHAAAAAAASALRPGQLVVLESTTYPGTTREVVAPILEAVGLRIGRDVFLAYSPEREDPGNGRFDTTAIPKLVAGLDAASHRLALALYGAMIERVISVASPEIAEAAKLTENVFRAVNIALANELKLSLGAMGLDVWAVIEAAATKPFGYMPFWPGPGPGGHCIPVDPHYLTWAARGRGAPATLIETALAVNRAAPLRVVERMATALGGRLAGRRILLLGLGYKRNIADLRDSPALVLIERLEEAGAVVGFHDPLVAEIPLLAEHPALAGRCGLPWDVAIAAEWDGALIATDHDGVDYAAVVARLPLVVDTRNACARLGLSGAHIVKA